MKYEYKKTYMVDPKSGAVTPVSKIIGDQKDKRAARWKALAKKQRQQIKELSK